MLKKRLKLLREEKKLNQNELASLLNISRVRYNNYETGKRTPDYDILQQIADFFDVTTDYLLGRTNLKSSPESTTKVVPTLDKELEEVLTKLESDGSALMYKGEPINDATKEALLISLKNTLELADKMHRMNKNK